YFYGLAEFTIGLGAFAVSTLFTTSEHLLASAGELNSFTYLFYSALALAISIFPWCFCMGTTFPFMMAYVKEREPKNADSFSFLYVANVLGAMGGTLLTAVALVEILGFHHTLWVAAACNFLIALTSLCLGLAQRNSPPQQADPSNPSPTPLISTEPSSNRFYIAILFSTGFISMAMEVVWSRGFVGVLKTQVYSFALIVFFYLLATFIGSAIYRRDVHRNRLRSHAAIFFWLAISALLPTFFLDPAITVQNFNDSGIDPLSAIMLLGSICPLCALLGYLTPSLIDQYSTGNPRRAGFAYAANVVGCILGPLVACYFLLPHISTHYSLVLLTCPFIFFCLFTSTPISLNRKLAGGILLAATLAFSLFFTADYDEWISKNYINAVVRRDYIASVDAYGQQGPTKGLLVNGFGMTTLTPITKCISHLTLALHQGPAKSVLVICFGMGTSYRSALTWDVDTTAVELVPSVPKMFGFYHADADKYLNHPKGHIIIDDGRRYLSRCGKKFDVIVVDPPPPLEAAGSSLLFSTEFYTLAKEHLNPNGILQMWYPGGDQTTNQAVIRSFVESFPYVRFFNSFEGWGTHMLGSMEPIQVPPIDQLVAKFPPAAKADLVEWNPPQTPAQLLSSVVLHEYRLETLLNLDPRIQITDDHPLNEYYLLRRMAKP
ncbi:MAG TPA: hypothetical protein VHS31_02350, partial [Tepidisphaeraceae bacterium]|nr:hypothetical protein [Tepidisphaeraceae bacterium]